MNPLLVDCDRYRIRQFLDNLFENAGRYTSAPGEIVLTAEQDEASVSFTAEDTAPCPSPDAIEHLFERFYRVEASRSRDHGGSGLGLAICREVRRTSDVPIITVTAKIEEIDRLLGLELGADDYLCKPFSPRELVARVKAILRRADGRSPSAGDRPARLIVEPERWIATLDGRRLDLTRCEFQLLSVLHGRPGRVFARSQLLDLAFPEDSEVIDRTIDSHVRNIRSKIASVADWDRSGPSTASVMRSTMNPPEKRRPCTVTSHCLQTRSTIASDCQLHRHRRLQRVDHDCAS